METLEGASRTRLGQGLCVISGLLFGSDSHFEKKPDFITSFSLGYIWLNIQNENTFISPARKFPHCLFVMQFFVSPELKSLVDSSFLI